MDVFSDCPRVAVIVRWLYTLGDLNCEVAVYLR